MALSTIIREPRTDSFAPHSISLSEILVAVEGRGTCCRNESGQKATKSITQRLLKPFRKLAVSSILRFIPGLLFQFRVTCEKKLQSAPQSLVNREL